jgi:hypothetical protein
MVVLRNGERQAQVGVHNMEVLPPHPTVLAYLKHSRLAAIGDSVGLRGQTTPPCPSSKSLALQLLLQILVV